MYILACSILRNNRLYFQNAKVSVMGSAQLSQVMTTVSKYETEVVYPVAPKLIIMPIRVPSQHASLQAEIKDQSTALYSTARLWDDGVIKPTDTRDVVGLGLALVSRGNQRGTHSNKFSTTWDGNKTGFGVFRM